MDKVTADKKLWIWLSHKILLFWLRLSRQVLRSESFEGVSLSRNEETWIMERRKGKVSILISGVKLFGLIWEYWIKDWRLKGFMMSLFEVGSRWVRGWRSFVVIFVMCADVEDAYLGFGWLSDKIEIGFFGFFGFLFWMARGIFFSIEDFGIIGKWLNLYLIKEIYQLK